MTAYAMICVDILLALNINRIKMTAKRVSGTEYSDDYTACLTSY